MPFAEGGREMRWGRRGVDGTIVAAASRWSARVPQPNDLNRNVSAWSRAICEEAHIRFVPQPL
jgi:hypothetical protein